MERETTQIDRLMDAIELVKEDRREEARRLLRDLIQEDNNFEDAWLWMSVAVDSLDQSSLCLDNVLRVNPGNSEAAGALYRIRKPEILEEKRRARIRFYSDLSLGLMWLLVVVSLYAMILSYT
jgi:hypothetical protein